MAIEFVGSQVATLGNSTATSFNISTSGLTGGSDTQVRVGDLCLVATGWASASDGNPGVTDATFTWSEVLDQYANDDNDTNLAVAWAIANTTPPANISMSALGSAIGSNGAILYVLRNVHASPMDQTAQGATGTNGNTPDPPSITVVNRDAFVVAFGFAAFANGGNRTITAAPSGYTGFRAFQSADGTTHDFMGAAAHRGPLAAGAQNPGAFTVSGTANSSSWAAASLSIRGLPSLIWNPTGILQPHLVR